MCGIAGFVIEDPVPGSGGLLRSMAAAIAHRGPDDEGFLETHAASGRYCIGLAHRRLAIIDLDGGHQPMGNEDGSIQVVFNGEIYNFEELRDELIARGHRFRTTSDTETIVHAYEEYGDDCVARFRGMFAFALWDAQRERLLLGRDRFGKKPVYLFEDGKGVLFASEIKSILQHPGFVKRADAGALWEYFAYRYVPGPRTLFQGICKLQPGFCAVWEKGRLRRWNWYRPPDCRVRMAAELPADRVAAFLEQLDDAVRVRMISNVPFGAFLSGGIDSSAVVGLMARHSLRPVNTFSVGFTDSSYSELTYARAVADHFRTNHHELTVSQDHLIDHLPALVRYRDAPVSEPSDIPIYLLSQEARRSVKMVLTGEGSDELLGGYPKHVFERYVGTYQKIPASVRQFLIEAFVHALPYRFRRLKTATVTMGLEDRPARMIRWFGALSNPERDVLVNFRPSAPTSRPGWLEGFGGSGSALRSILAFDQTSWLPDNLLERGDRMTMATSLEARMPFMDHKLTAFVSSLPDRYRVRGRQTKWLLRQAMKRLLPPEILDRPKVGFRVPVNEWFRGPMRDYVYDHLTATDSRTRHYYHESELHRVLREHVCGRHNHEKLIWALLNLEIWHRECLEMH